MANRYLIVSDLHLADVEDHRDGWKAYKASRFVIDRDFDELVRESSSRAGPDDRLTLVLNGDIFDFDVVTATPDDPPWPVSRFERRRGLRATAEKSAWKLERILADHRGFLATLARFMAAGHEVVYVLGNHDRELHFPEVQQVLRVAVAQSGEERGLDLRGARLRFEPWFYYRAGEVYVEHGHQYDLYTSFRYQLWPTVKIGRRECLAIPMGNLSNRYLMTRMGFFNPHASDYILNMFSYVSHWARHYMFSRHSLAFAWLWGSLLVMTMLLRQKRKLRTPPPEHERGLRQIARDYALGDEALSALAQLQPKPITSRLFRLMRELWLDRALIALLMTGGTVALALVPIPLWVKLMVPLVCFPLVYLVYEELARGESIFALEHEIPERARQVAEVLPARFVAFGHTHVPRLIPLSRETTFVDTGTWAPILDGDGEGGRQLRPGLRNFLSLSFEGEGPPRVDFGAWTPAGRGGRERALG